MTDTTLPDLTEGAEAVLARLRRTFEAMARLPLPRNAQPLVDRRRAGTLEEGTQFVVSFVDVTPLRLPHVFVTPGRRYDWRFAANLHATIAIRKGIDAQQVMYDIALLTNPYPNLVDFDRQVLASIVEGPQGLKLWPRRRGSESWCALFG